MDVLIFSKAAGAYEPTRFYEEAMKAGAFAATVAYSDLDFFVGSKRVEVIWRSEQLPIPKMAIFRSAGGDENYIPQRDYLIDLFKQKGVRVLNYRTYKRWSRLDKITQHFVFQKAKLPFINSKIYGLEERLLENEVKFPLIVKKNFSSQGRDVFKVGNRRGMRGIFNRGYLARMMLVQPFSKAGEDLRVIVIGGKAVGAMKRMAKPGKYLTNYSQGGLVENYDLTSDAEAKRIAEKTAREFEVDYVGVDLMKGEDGKWKLLEINRSCQFQGFEKATGINVAQETINFLSKIR